MKYSHAIRLLPLCLALTLASCGGGGGDSGTTAAAAASSPAAPSPAPAATGLDPQWRQSAYLRTEHTYGSITAQGTLAQTYVEECNALTRAVGGVAFTLPPSVAAQLGVDTVERYFDQGVRAATHNKGFILRLPDFERYAMEARGLPPGTNPPGPDCSSYRLEPRHTSLLWTNGRFYDINHNQRKATGSRRAADFTPRDIAPQPDVDRWPSELHANQRCLRVATTVLAGSTVLGDLGTSCVWDNGMPMQHFLGWPWPLVAEGQLSGVAGTSTVSIRPLEARMNAPQLGDEEQLRIPDGYTVKEIN
jgi:hypothetical protein